MSNIFDNAPKWEAVKVTDNSNILDNIAKAYTSQKSAFDDLQTAWKTFASDAQKAHQQESINALNNMSVDELTAVDAQTGQTAKEKFMADFAKRGEAIGGYNNQTEIDKAYDARVVSAIADDKVVKEHEVNRITQKLTPHIMAASNVYNAFSPNQVEESKNFLETYDYNRLKDHERDAAYSLLNANGLKRFTDNADYLNKRNLHDEASYEYEGKPVFEGHFQALAKTQAMLSIAKQMGDETLVRDLKSTLATLEAHENKEDAVKGTKEGIYTTNLKKMSEGTRRYIHANRDRLVREHEAAYAKQLGEYAKLGLEVQKHQLNIDKLELEKYVAENNVRQVDDKNTIYAQSVLNDANKGGESSLSYTGNKQISEKLSALGLPATTITNVNGEKVFNAEGFRNSIYDKAREIYFGHEELKLEQWQKNDYGNSTAILRFKSNLGNIMAAARTREYLLPDPSDPSKKVVRTLTNKEINAVVDTYLAEQGKNWGGWLPFDDADDPYVLGAVDMYYKNVAGSKFKDYLSNAYTLAANDLQGQISIGQIIFDSGAFDNPFIKDNLSKAHYDAANAVLQEVSKKASQLTPAERARRGASNTSKPATTSKNKTVGYNPPSATTTSKTPTKSYSQNRNGSYSTFGGANVSGIY